MKRTGTAIFVYPPYWHVVHQPEHSKATGQHVVVDTSVTPPQQVHGPCSKADAMAFARGTQNIWLAEKAQMPSSLEASS